MVIGSNATRSGILHIIVNKLQGFFKLLLLVLLSLLLIFCFFNIIQQIHQL
jgi:uncharacterized membrane protein